MAYSASLNNPRKVLRLRWPDTGMPYTLKKSVRRRTIGLGVDTEGLTVYAPQGALRREIESVLRHEANWIHRKLGEMRAKRVTPIRWQDGGELRFRGEPLLLRLKAVRKQVSPVRCNGRLVVSLADPTDKRELRTRVVDWYKRQALPYFRSRLAVYTPKLGLPVSGLELSDAKTHWGSCNWRGKIRISWRLIQAPREQIDYVVAHELAHLTAHRHSVRFWKTVQRIYPGYERPMSDLKDYGYAYCTL
ncbi:MAG: M48 family metallopeptidase [Burkholderiales bacterium]